MLANNRNFTNVSKRPYGVLISVDLFGIDNLRMWINIELFTNEYSQVAHRSRSNNPVNYCDALELIFISHFLNLGTFFFRHSFSWMEHLYALRPAINSVLCFTEMLLKSCMGGGNALISTNDSTIWLKAFKRIVIDICGAPQLFSDTQFSVRCSAFLFCERSGWNWLENTTDRINGEM